MHQKGIMCRFAFSVMSGSVLVLFVSLILNGYEKVFHKREKMNIVHVKAYFNLLFLNMNAGICLPLFICLSL